MTDVSRSDYYEWLENTEKYAIREEQDYQDYLLLKCIYDANINEFGI
jgi:putative transposase